MDGTVQTVNIPILLCKYRSVADIKSLTRVLDIINNERLYASYIKDLNDPMEGHFFDFDLKGNGYAGCQLSKTYGYLPLPISNIVNSLRIVSLSAIWDSPQMWAYYASNYEAVCLCFYSAKLLAPHISKVIYASKRDSVDISNINIPMEAAYAYILTKEYNWRHEHEWRIIVPNSSEDDSTFINYEEGGLAAVIIGNRCNKQVSQCLAEICSSKQIPVYSTYTDCAELRIHCLPFGSHITYNGSPISEQVDELLKKYNMVNISAL